MNGSDSDGLMVAKKNTNPSQNAIVAKKMEGFDGLQIPNSMLMATVTIKVLANLDIFLQGGPLPVYTWVYNSYK